MGVPIRPAPIQPILRAFPVLSAIANSFAAGRFPITGPGGLSLRETGGVRAGFAFLDSDLASRHKNAALL
jgi:hypothetical protein